jgi:glycosyltransferase involved in cell wall biosynthesis
MRVVYLSPYYLPSVGGIERFCQAIATEMHRLGNDVHVVTKTVEGKTDREEMDGIKIHRVRPFFQYSKAVIAPDVWKKLKELRPEVIHIQGPAPGMENFVGTSGKSKIVMTCHTDLTLDSSLSYKIISSAYRKFVFPRVLSKIDAVVLLSEAFRKTSKFSKLFARLDPNLIKIIPNAVDVERFNPGDKSKAEYKRDLDVNSRFFGTFVASMEPLHYYKGAEYLIQALSQLGGLDITFSFIGEGELKFKYIELAKELGIWDKVSFPGHGDNELLLKHYRAADVLVLPSISTAETQGIVLIEAMACGTPVITTKIHGPMEMVIEGYNGYTVLPRDSKGLAIVIETILSDDMRLREMQTNARKEAVKKYSWKNIAMDYLKLYETLIRKELNSINGD